MEGSAVLAVSKVVVEARVARAGAGSARVVCVDGGSAGCGRAGCGRVLRRHPANDVTSSSSHTSPVVTVYETSHAKRRGSTETRTVLYCRVNWRLILGRLLGTFGWARRC